MSKTHTASGRAVPDGAAGSGRMTNCGRRSALIVDTKPTCSRCASHERGQDAMRFLARNADAINSATGPMIPRSLPEQVEAYQRGAAAERARIVAWLRRRADTATYPLADVAEAIENRDDERTAT